MVRAYALRWVGDAASFIRAYLLAMIGIVPFALQAGWYGLFVYLFLIPYGLANILLFSLGTAISRNYLLKLAIFGAAIGVNAYGWLVEPLLAKIYSWDWLQGYALLLAEILVLFSLFYLLLERTKISTWLGEQFDAVETG